MKFEIQTAAQLDTQVSQVGLDLNRFVVRRNVLKGRSLCLVGPVPDTLELVTVKLHINSSSPVID